MNHSKNKQKHVQFDYENFNEKGLGKLKGQLKSSGVEVAEISATNRAINKDGQRIKRAQIFFINAQQADIFISDAGDVSQLKINGKPTPYKADTEAAFAKEIAQLLDRGQKAFDKSLAKKLKRIKVENPQKKPASRTLKARIDEAGRLIGEAQENRAVVQSELDKANADRQVSFSQRDGKLDELTQLRAKAQTLRDEIKTALAALGEK